MSSVSSFHFTLLALIALLIPAQSPAFEATAAYGISKPPQIGAYLNAKLPPDQSGRLPAKISDLGVFANPHELTPATNLIPYELNVTFWSDGAAKSRWISFPSQDGPQAAKIGFAPEGPWKFPSGTVFVKHFELATDETRPEQRRRLETRFLVRNRTGGVYGLTYKWRPDNSDADLLETNLTENIVIRTTTGVRTQSWYYPSRKDCLACHTDQAGLVLGVKTSQLNRDTTYPNGIADNQLRAWNHLDWFEPSFTETEIPGFLRLAAATDLSRSLEDRARSYLDANCAHCHRPGGTVANFDARYEIPLEKQKLIQGPVLIDQGIDGAKVIAPNDLWRSILFLRANTTEAIKMPPLAHDVLDQDSMALLKEWIQSLPGPTVLAPPKITPAGGNFAREVEVSLSSEEAGTTIHYTLDGSVPNKSDPVYTAPLKLTGPTVVRAKAYKPGSTRSITVQGIFIVNE